MSINKVRFELTSHNATYTLLHINNLTNNFAGINLAFIEKMRENIFKRKNTWVGILDSPKLDSPTHNIAVIKHVIGKGGCHLKQFTVNYGVDLIWHDRKSNQFMVWGMKQSVINALHALRRQVARFTTEQDILDATILNLQINTRQREEEEEHEFPDMKKMKCA
jgi:hypothetical protein